MGSVRGNESRVTLNEEDIRLLDQITDKSLIGVDLKTNTSSTASDFSPSPSPTSTPPPCVHCGRDVVTTRVYCPQCGSACHPSCSGITKKLSDGSFAKCCGRGTMALSGEDRSRLVDDISERVGKQIADQMALQLDAIVNKHVTVLRNEVARDLTDIRQSISNLQSAADANSASHNNDILALEDRITNIECNVTTKVNEVSAKVDSAMDTINGLKSEGASTVGTARDDYFDEMEDRLSRLNNVMVFGVPESQLQQPLQRKNDDLKSVGEIIAEAGVSENLESITCIRMGKYSKNLPQPRAIKVIMSSSANASLLIQIHRRQKKSQRSSELVKKTGVFPDLTELQRQKRKQVQAQLMSRMKEEKNPHLKIVTRNGRKKIISVQPREDPRAGN